MLDWLKKRFSKPEWDLAGVVQPWGDRLALATFIEDQLNGAGDQLPDSGVTLPDEERVSLREGVHFASGARDGIALYHLAGVEEPDAAAQILSLVRAVLADGGLVQLPTLYQALVAHRALTWIDDLGPGIARAPQPDPNRLYALGLFLATQAPDREAVKAGIAMLALLDLTEEDLGLLRLLGSHDEFTLYAVVALAAQSELPDLELWSVARRVTGWGRIHAVHRLSETDDPDIKAWLLREGFRNDVMERYLALTCAETGDLASALSELLQTQSLQTQSAGEPDEADAELLAGATVILGALLEEVGPTPGMESWEDGALAVDRWLCLIEGHGHAPLAALPVIARIAAAALSEESPWEPDAAAALARHAQRLIRDPRWRPRVLTALSDSGPAFDDAIAAAPILGLDTFDAWLRHLGHDDAKPWQGAIEAAKGAERLRLVLDRAADLLPADLAAGEDPSAYAPLTPAGAVLSTLLQALARHPGLGGNHLGVALRSPLAQHRNLALRALVAWPQHLWPDSTHEQVALLGAEDPEESVRQNALAAWGASIEA